ncbi:acyltransferase [Acuticoccus kandeliae]|uniref:acyltransferase n=1 Tax=Acuticoccus kandeliae TaxID=2073160 RepID=UPI000D3ECD11|nr:transferase [Acuticoccus kandeliae]
MLSLKRYLVNMLVALLPPTRWFGLYRILWQFAGDTVGRGANINGGAKVWGVGRVSVGDNSWLGMNLVVIVPDRAEVRIGANVDIGPDVLLECGSHEVGGAKRRAGKGHARSIEIGSGTWIGCRATLLGGARIGSGSVIAAGALVIAGDYPDNVLLAGVPAKVVHRLGETGEPKE